MTSETLKEIYEEIDRECLPETDTVKMDTIKHIFMKYGAREEDLN